MTDTATDRYKARQQSQGSNTNTWGDDKLNEVLRLLDRGSKGYQALAMTGDTTLTWTNYVATNDGQCSVLKLTGSLSSAASLTVPSTQWQWDVIWNTTGQTITVKASAGTGVAIPNGRKAAVFCDATDCYLSVPNILDSITLTNNRDSVDKLALETAIANASLPASAGTVLVSATDTTAGYIGAKIDPDGDLTSSVASSGGNETLVLSVSPYWSAQRVLSTGPITVLDRDILMLDTSSALALTTPATGRFRVIDTSGEAAANNITITPDSGTITFGTIDTNYFSGEYRWNATTSNWDLA